MKNKGYHIDDIIGKKGVEKQYDKEMKGQDGAQTLEVDVHGNVIREIKNTESIMGKKLYLSIDLDLQKYMTEEFRGKSGAFIAMEAKTGKLINSKAKPLVNKGIAGLYPPGSTFKAVTGLGILESGISPQETVYSTGVYEKGNQIYRDSHTYGHGITNFFRSIEESVNTYYYYFAEKAGLSNIIKYAREFNIGKKTGIDIPGELSGTLPTPEWKKERFKRPRDQKWVLGDLINMSIGQGYVLSTPIQIASVYQTIANNGVTMKPTVVDKFIKFDGTVEENKPVEVRKINISQRNIKLLQNALRLPVIGARGTASILRINGYPVSAKTGTAQNSSYYNNHSWIAGYFPSNNPEIVFVSIVEGGGYGGVASGLLARSFILKYRDKYVLKIKNNENEGIKKNN